MPDGSQTRAAEARPSPGTPVPGLGLSFGPHEMTIFPCRIRLWCCLAATCAAGAAPVANANERIAKVLRDSLPRYDPAIHAAEQQRRAEAAAKVASQKTPTPAPERKTAKPIPPPRGASDPDVLELAPYQVRGARVRVSDGLPRLTAPGALRPGENPDAPMLSATERERRLRRKHLGALDYVLLNPHWLFGSGRAIEAERREVFAAQMNDLADSIDLAQASGANEEELKQLRELYLQLYHHRPK